MKDGTAVSIDKLEVGGNVLIAGLPPADGQYELSDGTMLTTVNGVITVLVAPSDDGAATADMAALKSQLTSMTTKLAAQEKALNTVKADYAKAIAKFAKHDEALTGLLSVVENIANESTDEPADTPQNFKNQNTKGSKNQKQYSEMTPLEKFRASKN